MNEYKVTIIGSCIIVILNINFILFDIEPFEMFIQFLDTLEYLEIDEFIIPLILVIIFFLIDKIYLYKKSIFENNKIKEYKEKLEINTNLLNEYLCQIQMFKFEANKMEGFDKDTLKELENLSEKIESQIDKSDT